MYMLSDNESINENKCIFKKYFIIPYDDLQSQVEYQILFSSNVQFNKLSALKCN